MPSENNLCRYYYRDGRCYLRVREMGYSLRNDNSLCRSHGQESGCTEHEYWTRPERCCYTCERYAPEDNICNSMRRESMPYQDCASWTARPPEPPKSRKYISQDGFEIVPLRRGFNEIIPLWKILNKVISTTKKDCFICGGYARYCASPKFDVIKAGDVDVYSEDDTAFNKVTQLLKYNKLKVKAENDMAITFERPKSGDFHYMPPIQIIKPIKIARIIAFGSKEEILSNFDFSVIRAAIESPTEVLVDKDFIHDESHKLLRLKNIHCPISSTLRCLKYAQKGYWLRPIEAMKLFIDWDNRDDDYRLKLIDFLEKAEVGTGLTQEQVDELETLMRID